MGEVISVNFRVGERFRTDNEGRLVLTIDDVVPLDVRKIILYFSPPWVQNELYGLMQDVQKELADHNGTLSLESYEAFVNDLEAIHSKVPHL